MTPEELAARHPRLYHVTEPGAWEVMRRLGLLSAEALLHAAGCEPAEIERLTTQRRPLRVVLNSTPIGRLVLTDNTPLSEVALARCLEDGLQPAEWLRMLNQRAFFWVEDARMRGLRDARSNQKHPREVLVFDTLSLARAHADRVELAPFNTGSTLRAAVSRGHATFTPLGAMSYAEWQRKRGAVKRTPDRIVEVVVRGGVPDIERHFIERREAAGA